MASKTKAERLSKKPVDPRLSLEERDKTYQGYVDAVIKAANYAACMGYLNTGPDAVAMKMGAKCAAASLPPSVADDWVQVVKQAMESNVCNQLVDGGKCNPLAPDEEVVPLLVNSTPRSRTGVYLSDLAIQLFRTQSGSYRRLPG